MKKTFYDKLSSRMKRHYDAEEKVTPHTERFKELMNRNKPIKGRQYFTDEEREYLGKEDLPTFMELFEIDALFYMED